MGFSPNVWAAVQTDTHTYIVSAEDDAVLAINRQTGKETRISVGETPNFMVIHGDKGYVLSWASNSIFVLDLQRNTVTQTIPVGYFPKSMVIHGNMGYLMNWGSKDVSVLNLQTNTVIQNIPVGETPNFMVIHGDKGYVLNLLSHNVSVIDLNSNAVIQTIPVGRDPRSVVIHGDKGYVVDYLSHNVSVINLKTNTVTQIIPVGRNPKSMVIHGEMGYVVESNSNNVSVIDLNSNTVTQTIPVGESPHSMVIHGEVGYVVNYGQNTVSVLDLKSNTVTQTIPVGENPLSMVIHGKFGYVNHHYPSVFTIIDLQTNRVVTTFENPDNKTIDFSDTHVHLGLEKVRPLYPTLASINLAKAEKTLSEFVAMMPEVFQLGEIDKRSFPKEENGFDILASYTLAQEIFWDLKTGKPLMDPKNILATLITMKYPQRFLKTEAGAWLRKRLHMAFFQTVWLGDKDKVLKMLKYFVQLQDPVITSLATYTFKDAKESSDQKATNSTKVN